MFRRTLIIHVAFDVVLLPRTMKATAADKAAHVSKIKTLAMSSTRKTRASRHISIVVWPCLIDIMPSADKFHRHRHFISSKVSSTSQGSLLRSLLGVAKVYWYLNKNGKPCGGPDLLKAAEFFQRVVKELMMAWEKDFLFAGGC